MKKLLGCVLFVVVAACGSSSSSHADAAIDSHAAVDAPAGLTVKNYLGWCSVSVNGATATSAAVQTVSVAPGTIPLTATAASASFEIAANMWHHTTGDTGTGDTGTVTGTTSAATVVVGSTAKCVWVCCPFSNGTGCEPANVPEQCP